MTRTVLLAFACFALSVAPALAARIYNLTPLPIEVKGLSGGESIGLAAGARSASLSWSAKRVYVLDEHGKQICDVDFGWRSEVVAGHYLLVTNYGTRVNCQLCDADGKRMYGGTGSFGPYWASMLETKKSEKQGCP